MLCCIRRETGDELKEGATGEIVLAKTPFYAESGGQLGDKGVIRGPAGEFEVWDTQRPAEGLVLHIGKVVQGRVAATDHVAAVVNSDRRKRAARHHTGTHLLQFALREIVGSAIKQAGSMVAPERLRFDFSYFQAIPADKLEAVEHRVNELILENLPVKTYSMALKDVPGSGIIAMFDEKYGDTVRVVDVSGFSRELCGGTHVSATGDLGLFRIVSESSVASGVRRIEAVCGWAAYEWMRREHELVKTLSHRFSASPEELGQRVDALMEKTKALEKELRQKSAQSAAAQADGLVDRQRPVAGVAVVVEAVGELDLDNLRGMMDVLRAKLPSGIVCWEARTRACFVCSVSDDLVKRGLHAAN